MTRPAKRFTGDFPTAALAWAASLGELFPVYVWGLYLMVLGFSVAFVAQPYGYATWQGWVGGAGLATGAIGLIMIYGTIHKQKGKGP